LLLITDSRRCRCKKNWPQNANDNAATAANPAIFPSPDDRNGCLRGEFLSLSAPLSPVPAGFFVGGDDDDDDKRIPALKPRPAVHQPAWIGSCAASKQAALHDYNTAATSS